MTKAGDQGAELAVLDSILADTAGIQLRTEQSKSGTVEEDAIMSFAISLIEIDSGAIPLADIDITGITATMEKSTVGGAFSAAGITQPTFAKVNGLVSVDYRFLAAQWINGDVYKLSVSGIEVEVNSKTVFIKDMIWSNMVFESANIETKIDIIQALADEIKNDIHSNIKYFGSAGTPAAETHRADRITLKPDPFIPDAGNDTWGSWSQVLGSSDTPVVGGNTKFNLKKILIIDHEHNTQDYFIQIASGESAGLAGKLASEDFTETGQLVGDFSGDTMPLDVQSPSYNSGDKIWVRICAPLQNTSELSFYIGIHE